MSECSDISEKLTEFVEGELSGAEQARVTAHLGGCASCKGEVQSLQAMVRSLSELPELAPPAGVEGRVMARLRARSGKMPAPPPMPGWLGWLRASPLRAASVAILLVAIGVAGVRMRATTPGGEQLAAVPSGVKLEVSAGEARVEGSTASTGSALAEGALLEASADFRGRLVYPDGTSVKVRPGASVRVFAHSLGLKQGQVWLKVKKGGAGFQVETAQAVVAVRGTVFGVDCDSASGQTRVQVEEGAVEFKTAGDSVMLAAGQGATSSGDKITRHDGFLEVFEMNRDDFVGKPRSN